MQNTQVSKRRVILVDAKTGCFQPRSCAPRCGTMHRNACVPSSTRVDFKLEL